MRHVRRIFSAFLGLVMVFPFMAVWANVPDEESVYSEDNGQEQISMIEEDLGSVDEVSDAENSHANIESDDGVLGAISPTSDDSSHEQNAPDVSGQQEEIAQDETEESVPHFSGLVINEVHPKSEYIELFFSGTSEIDLSALQFSELSGGNEKRWNVIDFTDTQTLFPSSFTVLSLSRKINDSGDTIRLYADANSVDPIDTVSVPSAQGDQSFSRDENGDFLWTTPSPGNENIFANEPAGDDENSGQDQEEDNQDASEDGDGQNADTTNEDGENSGEHNSSGEDEPEGDSGENTSDDDQGDTADGENGNEDTATQDEDLPQETPNFSLLLLNEVDLGAEFIELFNSGETELDLSALQFSELSGENEVRRDFADFTQMLSLAPQEFVVLEMSSKLNNSGEMIRLYTSEQDPDPFFTLEIPSHQSEQSFSRQVDGAFSWTTPTPGSENIFSNELEGGNGDSGQDQSAGDDNQNTSTDENEDGENSDNEHDDSGNNESSENDENSEDENNENSGVNSEDEADISEQSTEQDLSFLFLNEVDLDAEFLELFNSGETELDLSTLQFSELSGENEVRRDFGDFTQTLSLAPQEFMILEMSSKLNNSGEMIRLYASEQDPDPFFTLEVPSHQSGQSFSRQADGSFAWTTPTPGAENEMALLSSENGDGGDEEFLLTNADFQGIYVNEVDADSEFVEIWNASDVAVDLSTFEFSELSGQTEKRWSFSDFTQMLVIEPHGFVLLEMSSKLNNSGDTLRVYIHASATEPLQSLVVPKARAGQTFARTPEGNFVQTLSPTPNAENVIQIPSSSSSQKTEQKKKGSNSFFPTSQISSLAHEAVVLQISEISFNDPHHDRIEVWCKECGSGLDLGGFQMLDDDVFFEIPSETIVQTGDYLVFSLKHDWERSEKTEWGWNFFLSHRGLTRTDETLMIANGEGNLEDAVCWTNHNGKFSSGEDNDVRYMKSQKHWRSDASSDYQCFPSESIGSKMSLARTHDADTNTADDFFPTRDNTFGAVNPPPLTTSAEVSLVINRLFFLPDHDPLVQIVNTGSQTAQLNGFRLMQNDDVVVQLGDTDLHPRQTLWVPLTRDIKGNLFLTFSDAWGEPEDFLCTQELKSYRQNDFAQRTVLQQRLYRRQMWNQRELSSCIAGEPTSGVLHRSGNVDTNSAIDFTWTEFSDASEVSETLFISALEPNPKGKDADAEWFSLGTHTSMSDISPWMVRVGNNVMFLPRQSLRAGDELKISGQNSDLKSLKNSDGSIDLISPDGHIFSATWSFAKEGSVLRLINGAFEWDHLKQKSASQKKSTSYHDRDHDKIPDILESQLGGDPDQFDDLDSSVVQKYQEHVADTVSLTPSSEPTFLVLSGTTEPNAQVRFFIHSDLVTAVATSDEKGNFHAEISDIFQPGEHSINMVITNQFGMRTVVKNAEQFELPRGIRTDEISTLALISVIPNPEGKDADHESVVLKNTSNTAGFIRNWTISNGKKTLELPDTFFDAGEEKTFRGKSILPTLKNSEGTVMIHDFSGALHDSLSWQKARNGEIIGPGIVWKKPSKRKKRSRKRSQKPISDITSDLPNTDEGVLISFSDQSVTILSSATGAERTYLFDDKNPQHLFLLSHVMNEGDSLLLTLSEENTILALENHSYIASDISYSHTSLRVPSISLMVILLGICLLVLMMGARFDLFSQRRVAMG